MPTGFALLLALSLQQATEIQIDQSDHMVKIKFQNEIEFCISGDHLKVSQTPDSIKVVHQDNKSKWTRTYSLDSKQNTLKVAVVSKNVSLEGEIFKSLSPGYQPFWTASHGFGRVSENLCVLLDPHDLPLQLFEEQGAFRIGMAGKLSDDAKYGFQVFLKKHALERALEARSRQYIAPQLERAWPQVVPMANYCLSVFGFGELEEESSPASAAQTEKERELRENSPWWDGEIKNLEVGAPRKPGFVSWDRSHNAMRAAWGMKWWAEKLKVEEWADRAKELFRLSLLAPRHGVSASTKFSLRARKWSQSAESLETLYWATRWLNKWPNSELKDLTENALRQSFEDPRFLAPASATALYDRVKLAQIVSKSHLNPPILKMAKHLLENLEPKTRNVVAPSSLEAAEALAELPGRDFECIPISEIDTANLGRRALVFLRQGAKTGLKSLFEEGVTLLRSQLLMLNDPSSAASGILLPNLSIGQASPSRNPHSYEPMAWKGFEFGEGQILATFAEALDEFGGFYVSKQGWAVGIDGCKSGSELNPVDAFSLNPIPFIGDHELIIGSEMIRVKKAPTISRLEAELREKENIVTAIPVSIPMGSLNEGVLASSDGSWKSPMSIGLRGFEVPVPATILHDQNTFVFQGTLGGQQIMPIKLGLSLSPVTWNGYGDLLNEWINRSNRITTGDKFQEGQAISNSFYGAGGTVEFDAEFYGKGAEIRLVNTRDSLILKRALPGHNSWSLAAWNGIPLHFEIRGSKSGRCSMKNLTMRR